MNEDLKTYIQDQLEKGVSKDQIAQNLKEEGGWSAEDVQAVFSETGEKSTPEASNQVVDEEAPVSNNWNSLETGKHKNKFLVPILVAVFLIIVGFIVMVFVLDIFKTSSPVNDGGAVETPIENMDSSSVVNKNGFTFTPPVGWSLWEGRSASEDSINVFTEASAIGKKTPTTIEELQVFQTEFKDFVKNQLQEKMELWSPQNSQRLVYTKGPVDTSSRDIDVLNTYLGNENEYELSGGELPRPFVTINFQVYDEEFINSNLNEEGVLSSRTVNFLDGSALFKRTVYEVVRKESNAFLEVSLRDGKILRLEAVVDNSMNDEEVLSYLVEFSRKLLIE